MLAMCEHVGRMQLNQLLNFKIKISINFTPELLSPFCYRNDNDNIKALKSMAFFVFHLQEANLQQFLKLRYELHAVENTIFLDFVYFT